MIWCVEDDTGIRDIELYTLRSVGFETNGFQNADELFAALKSQKPSLILLDVMLPGMDGVEILKKLKASSETCDIPVIMATAKGMEYDKIQSLDLGADDYLVKPFGMMEMVSRVKAVLRRCGHNETPHVLTNGGIMLDTSAHTVSVDGEKIQLTYKEFELLKLFLNNPKKVFTREQLFSEIWGLNYVGETRTVDMHIRTLRQKIGTYSDLIETVRNVGYRMEVWRK
jgi:two-component system, OmpR family, alkaline phosphatase synthesis response regulator PhoP